jgi:hypothetical protein
MVCVPVVSRLEEFVQARGKSNIVDLANGVQVGYRIRWDGGNRWNLGAGQCTYFFYGAWSAAS